MPLTAFGAALVTPVVCHPDVAVDVLSHQPAKVTEISDLVRRAAASGQAMYPVGGQTQWRLGLPPSHPGILLDTRKLDQVIDYPARDMTITVQAGMTVARLQTTLATEKQRLPVDVPHADRATIGGILATNVSGPRRYAYGTLRDYVIGISVVNDEGHEVKAGGRVVKNVAGYDLCKLYIGSLGTLGVITQVTFKVRPKPDEQALFAFPCEEDEIEATLQQLHESKTKPVCIELLNPAAGKLMSETLQVMWPDQWSIILGFEGNPDALKWQVRQLIQEIGGRHFLCGTLGHCADPPMRDLIEFAGKNSGPLSFKAGVPPSQVAAFCIGAARILEPILMQSQAGNGIVVGHCLGIEVVSGVIKARELATAMGGHLVVTRCPAAWKNAEFIWGPSRGDIIMMRAVKEKLDPRGLFNPGRFVGGI